MGVVLDEPTPIWGGSTAAPTFKTVMQFGLQRLGIGPGPVLPDGGTSLPGPLLGPLLGPLPGPLLGPLLGPARSGDAPAYPSPNPSATPLAPGVAE